MTAYADLDTSIIDELPPGRTPITTVALPDSRRQDVIERVRLACEEGKQAYWVCTLIEESEVLECQAAEDTAAELQTLLPGLHIGLVHGRMRPVEKQRVMEEFKAGILQLLVATTVIEVGVDVPNASLMIIENPERLGLAQLHQLRGRVGRGSVASHCVLLYHAPCPRPPRAASGYCGRPMTAFSSPSGIWNCAAQASCSVPARPAWPISRSPIWCATSRSSLRCRRWRAS